MRGDILILGVIAVGAVVTLVLFYIERQNRKELYFLGNKKKIIEYYLQKLFDIDQIRGDNKKKLDEIKLLSKKLFNDYYGLDLNVSYSKLAEFFNEKNNLPLKEFSEIMLGCYYYSQEVDDKTIRTLISILRKEVMNIPMKKGAKKEGYLEIKKNEEARNKLIKEVTMHLKQENHPRAEKVYYKLEKTNGDPSYHGRLSRLYDKIISLYYKKKKNSNEKKVSSIASSVNVRVRAKGTKKHSMQLKRNKKK